MSKSLFLALGIVVALGQGCRSSVLAKLVGDKKGDNKAEANAAIDPAVPSGDATDTGIGIDPNALEKTSDIPKVEQAPATGETAFSPSKNIDQTFLNSFLDEIAGPKGNGRGTGSPGNNQIAQRITEEFKAAGLQPGGVNGTYYQPFDAKGSATQNIIAVLPGETDDVIVIGAHMDHLGARRGTVYYGADDNASGTTGLVTMAKAFAKSPIKLKRTLVFISFSGEELGLLGSLFYVKNPTVPMAKIKFMVNMDMIGYSHNALNIIGVETTLEGDRFARDLISKTGITPTFLASVAQGGSDHMPFEKLGVPVGVFHTGLHDNYHQPTDTVEKIDRPNLAIVTGLAADFAWSLATVERIEPRPLALAPVVLSGVSSGIHSHGCEPGFASFEDIQNSLKELK